MSLKKSASYERIRPITPRFSSGEKVIMASLFLLLSKLGIRAAKRDEGARWVRWRTVKPEDNLKWLLYEPK